MFYRIICLLTSVFIFTACQPNTESAAFRIIGPKAFTRQIDSPDIQLVDVRTPSEVAQGTIEGAVNIDYKVSDFLEKATRELNPDEPVYLYCRTGRRSAAAAQQLLTAGFVEIIDLKGGYVAWKASGR